MDANWDVLQAVDSAARLAAFAVIPIFGALIARHGEQKILKSIEYKRTGLTSEVPANLAELEAFLKAPEGYGDDIPIDPNSHARRLPRQHCVLHAKAVIADSEAIFITSANLTEAALDWNIEVGVLLRDRPVALTATKHFMALIDQERLMPLPQA